MSRDKQHTILKKGLFVLTLLILLLPIAQKQLHFFDIAPLSGDFVPKEKVEFSLNDWFKGDYQSKKEAYINEKFGFRNLCVRLNNQIAFTFFNYAKANGVTIGKDNYLYEENYIKAYYGDDFIGEGSIVKKVTQLKEIQTALKQKNIDLIVALAPGKGSFYPEFIPDRPPIQQEKNTNYTTYAKSLQEQQVNFIDLKKWFLQMKDTSSYPLYPKCGIHWSKYGEVLVLDSLLKHIGNLRGIQTPQIAIKKIEIPDTIRGTDDDIEQGMNLLFNIPDFKMAYPVISKIADSNTTCPRMLTIADSYFWGIYGEGFVKSYFNNGQFWYYNEQVYSQNSEEPTAVEELDFIKEIEKHDVILLLSTDANLSRFPYGIADRLYDVYVKGNKNALSKKEQRIRYFIKFIKESSELMQQMKKQAKQNKQSLEKEIRANASYYFWKENNK